MQHIISTKDLKLSKNENEYLEKKLNSLDRIVQTFGDSVRMNVNLERETRHHEKGEIYLAEIILYLPQKKLVVKCEADTISNAIDEAKHTLHLQIKEFKERQVDKNRNQNNA